MLKTILAKILGRAGEELVVRAAPYVEDAIKKGRRKDEVTEILRVALKKLEDVL